HADVVGPGHGGPAVARLPRWQGRAVLPRQRKALLRRAMADETVEVLRQVELDLPVRRTGDAARGAAVHRLPERDGTGNAFVVVLTVEVGYVGSSSRRRWSTGIAATSRA